MTGWDLNGNIHGLSTKLWGDMTQAEWEQVSEAAVGKRASTKAEEITAPGRKRSQKTRNMVGVLGS